MTKIRDWTNAVAEARVNGVFTEEEKRDCQDFRFCLIGAMNRKAGKELHVSHPVLEALGYAFCAAVCHDEVEMAFHVKTAIDRYCKQYCGI
jgi:hypothetical protein